MADIVGQRELFGGLPAARAADWLGFGRTRAGKDVRRLGRMMLIAAVPIAGRAAPPRKPFGAAWSSLVPHVALAGRRVLSCSRLSSARNGSCPRAQAIRRLQACGPRAAGLVTRGVDRHLVLEQNTFDLII